MKKLFGLGKGLESLIPTRRPAAPVVEPVATNSTPKRSARPKKPVKSPDLESGNVFYVETASIIANPNQPRTEFDEDALKDLAASIKKYGVLQPLIVTKIEEETKNGMTVRYNLIAGERRLRASKLARVPHVPVIIKDEFEEDKTRLEVALVENLQREDLNPMEEAEAYARLVKDFGMTQQAIATQVGKSRELVANTLRLQNLEEPIKKALRENLLTRTQARTLLAFKDEKKRMDVFRQFLQGGVAVRHVEQSAKEHREQGSDQPLHNQRFQQLQSNLSRHVGMPVMIKNTAKGGKVEIRFASLEELNAIAKTILD